MTIKPATDGFLEGLLAVTQPRSLTFTVDLAPGFRALFNVVTDYSDTVKNRLASQRFVEEFPALSAQEDWRPFAKLVPVALGLACYAGRTCAGTQRFLPLSQEEVAEIVEREGEDAKIPEGRWVDGPPLTALDFVTIAKNRTNVFDDLRDRLNEGQYDVVERATAAAVETAKNGSSEIPSGTTA